MDDDFQDITNLSEDELLRRLSCYYLLAPSLIVHPAYFWQSLKTHDLVGTVGREILRPPFTQLELGMHESIDEYMKQRIAHLRRGNTHTRELRSYEAFGSDLTREARDLDVRFNTAERRSTTSRRRDQEFRVNLEADFNHRNLDESTLASLLSTLTVNKNGLLIESRLGADMQRFVSTADLVSVDTVLHHVHTLGYPELTDNSAIKKRLLALYYQTYCDYDLIIPGTDKLKPGGIVNPYDTSIFWKVVTGLFGEAAMHLSTPNDPEMTRALRDLRETSDWLRFTEIYFDFMATIDFSVRSQPEIVLDAVREIHPGRSRNYILRQLWQRGKVAVSGAILSTAGAAGFTVGGPLAISLAAVGTAGIAVSGVSIAQMVRRFNDQYHSQDVVRIQERVKLEVDKALKDIALRTGD